jgi:hypothetical protein
MDQNVASLCELSGMTKPTELACMPPISLARARAMSARFISSFFHTYSAA